MSATGSQVPFDPSVRTRWLMTQPAAAHFASVAPHRTRCRRDARRWPERAAGRRQVDVHGCRPGRSANEVGGHVDVPCRAVARARCGRASPTRSASACGGRTSRARRRTGSRVRAGRQPDDVRAVVAAIGHEGDAVEVGDPREVDGVGQVGVGDDDEVDGRRPPGLRDAVGDRAVQAPAGRQIDRGADAVRPSPRPRRRRTRPRPARSHAASTTRRHLPGQLGPRRLVEGGRQPQLCAPERLHRHEDSGMRMRSEVYGRTAI